MIITYIILGAIIWQTVCLILAFTFDNEDNILYISIGIWAPILMVIGKICQKVRLIFARRYNGYQIFGKNKNDWFTTVYMTPKTAAKFRTVEEYGYNYAIKLAKEGKDFKSCPLKQDIIKEGQMFPGFSEDFFKKFLKVP